MHWIQYHYFNVSLENRSLFGKKSAYLALKSSKKKIRKTWYIRQKGLKI